LGCVDNEDTDSGAGFTIGGTVAREGNVVTSTVDRLARWALQGVIGHVATSNTTTFGWDGDRSVSGLAFSTTESAILLRPRSPWGHDAIHRTASSKAILNIGCVSTAVSTTIRRCSVDSTGSGLGGVATGGTTGGPFAPVAIGAVNRRAAVTVGDGAVASSAVATVVLAAIGERTAVLVREDTFTIASISRDITERSLTQVGDRASNIRGQVLTATSNSLIAITSLTDVGGVTVSSANPRTVVGSWRGMQDTFVDGTGQLIVTVGVTEAGRSNVGTVLSRGTRLPLGEVGSVGTGLATIGRRSDDLVVFVLCKVVAIAFGPVSTSRAEGFDTRFGAGVNLCWGTGVSPVGTIS